MTLFVLVVLGARGDSPEKLIDACLRGLMMDVSLIQVKLKQPHHHWFVIFLTVSEESSPPAASQEPRQKDTEACRLVGCCVRRLYVLQTWELNGLIEAGTLSSGRLQNKSIVQSLNGHRELGFT